MSVRAGADIGTGRGALALAKRLDRADTRNHKIIHLEENIRAANVALKRSDWQELENALAKVRIVGDRYPAEQQRQVQKNLGRLRPQ